ncbi:hypothetical protein AKJ16_DCAP23842, partial [Drosera capensis]
EVRFSRLSSTHTGCSGHLNTEWDFSFHFFMFGFAIQTKHTNLGACIGR